MAKITYTNKLTLNPQPSIANENKVTDSDMNEIKSVVNGLIVNTYSDSQENTYSCDYVNKLNTYSTPEQRIGTWIDDKPLYRKVYVLDATNYTDGYDFDISSLNFDYINIETCFIKYFLNSTWFCFYNNYYYNSSDYFWGFRRNDVIRFRIGSTQLGATNKTITLVLQYTKTTD